MVQQYYSICIKLWNSVVLIQMFAFNSFTITDYRMEASWCRDDMQFNTETSKMDMVQWKEGKEQLFYHCCVVSKEDN